MIGAVCPRIKITRVTKKERKSSQGGMKLYFSWTPSSVGFVSRCVMSPETPTSLQPPLSPPPPIFYPQPLTIYLRLPQKPLNRYPKTTICLAERLMGIAQQGHYSNTSWVWGWRGSAVADCIGHLSCPVYTVSQVIPPQPQELSRL